MFSYICNFFEFMWFFIILGLDKAIKHCIKNVMLKKDVANIYNLRLILMYPTKPLFIY